MKQLMIAGGLLALLSWAVAQEKAVQPAPMTKAQCQSLKQFGLGEFKKPSWLKPDCSVAAKMAIGQFKALFPQQLFIQTYQTQFKEYGAPKAANELMTMMAKAGYTLKKSENDQGKMMLIFESQKHKKSYGVFMSPNNKKKEFNFILVKSKR